MHNADFDIIFINYEFSLLPFNVEPLRLHDHIDTLRLARRAFPHQKATLNDLCERFGVNYLHRSFHGAL